MRLRHEWCESQSVGLAIPLLSVELGLLIRSLVVVTYWLRSINISPRRRGDKLF